jgi:putative SOS response-associated peptidase YedK
LNAKIETVFEKPSFRDVLQNRCLIIATAFYEWRWNDEKGKTKQKFQINAETEIFAFAGLYSNWTNPENGDILKTYTMLTTEANATMQYIHNHKKRMPIILKQDDEQNWLNGNLAIEKIAFPYECNLVGFEV